MQTKSMYLCKRISLNERYLRSEILLIGHGNGKARGMVHFEMYLQRKHPDLAKRVVDTLDTNLMGMTEPEILKMARDWFDAHSPVKHAV